MATDELHPLPDETGLPAKPSYPLVNALTAQRKAQLMTQSELAHQAGLSRMTIQRLEGNGLDPRLSTLQEMARVLDHEIVIIPTDLHDAFAHWLRVQNGEPPPHYGR